MEEDKKDETDLEVRPAEVETVKKPDDVETKLLNRQVASSSIQVKQLLMWLVLLVVCGGFAMLILSFSSEDETVDNNDSPSGSSQQAAADSGGVSVESIQELVSENDVLWTASLETLISEYDQTNDNVSLVFTDTSIKIMSNGLPDHGTGEFPNANNPNTISEQDGDYTISRTPIYVGTATSVRIPGITLGGVPMEPGTAETDAQTGWSIEAFNPSKIFNPGVDDHNAHVQPNGTYHYHGLPEVLVTTGDEHSNLIGFAADGFPIYGNHGYRDPTNSDGPVDHMTSSWRLKEGERGAGEPSGVYNGDYTNDYEFKEDTGDLDECNGRFTITPEFPNGTYAYFMTEQFPFIGRCAMGEVLDSFSTTNQPGGQQLGPPPQGGPQGPPQ